MMRVFAGFAAALWAVGVWAPQASAACQIKSFAELPVTVVDHRFLVDAAIDGKPVQLIFDSGAFGTSLTTDAARKLGVVFAGDGNERITGIGGGARAMVHRVSELRLGNVTRTNTTVVITSKAHLDHDAAGVLGRDEYGGFDLEFDIPHHVIRFLRAEGCADAQMPYWAKTAYSETPLVRLPDDISAEYRVDVVLNGRPIEMTVDSGAADTVVSTSGAYSAGLRPGELKRVGESGGIGAYRVDTYLGKFKTVSIDGEAVQNVDLPVADLFHYSPSLKTGSLVATENTNFAQGLLGADFLMSNRVLLSHTHNMMYFTYEGGPVFGPAAGLRPTEVKANASPGTSSPP